MTDHRAIQYVDVHSHKKNDEGNVIRIHNVLLHEYNPKALIDGSLYSVGIHPWYINFTDEMPGSAAFSDERIIAIGETGLDKLRGPDLSIQERVFLHHIELSETLKKPLIIHNVRMTHRILRIQKEVKPEQPWILHGFTGNVEQAKQLLSYNIYFSFGARVLNSRKSIEAFGLIPLNRIFIETDEGEMKIQELYEAFSTIFLKKKDLLSEVILKTFQMVFY